MSRPQSRGGKHPGYEPVTPTGFNNSRAVHATANREVIYVPFLRQQLPLAGRIHERLRAAVLFSRT